MAEKITDAENSKAQSRAVKIIKICGFVLLCCIFVALLINSLLCIFKKDYYPTFGDKRLFAIVSDSMNPEIATGRLIVCRVPESEDEIEVGTVITYKLKQGKSVTLITHRVVEIKSGGVTTYVTRGDNAPANDAFTPAYGDIVGIYTGKGCNVLGYIIGFLQSTEGAIALIVITLIFCFSAIMISYINHVRIWRNSALSALNKIRSVLSKAQVEELKTIGDVVGIINKDPETKKELKRKDRKLEWFLITGALPKRPYNDDLCPTDEMSSDIEKKIPYLCYSYPQDGAGEYSGGFDGYSDDRYSGYTDGFDYDVYGGDADDGYFDDSLDNLGDGFDDADNLDDADED